MALKEALTTAKNILLDVDFAKSNPDSKSFLSTTLFSIIETIDAGTFEILPLENKVGISKVYQAFENIDEILTTHLNNSKVHRHIQFSLD